MADGTESEASDENGSKKGSRLWKYSSKAGVGAAKLTATGVKAGIKAGGDVAGDVVRGEFAQRAAWMGKPAGFATSVGKIPFAILKWAGSMIKAYTGAILSVMFILAVVTFFLMGGGPKLMKYADDLGITPGITKSVTLVSSFFKDPAGVIGGRYGSFTNPDVIEEKPKKGVEFFSVTTAKLYYTNHKIDIAGRVKIDPLPDTDTEVIFSCEMPDQNGKDIKGEFLITGAPRPEVESNEEFTLKIPAGEMPIIKGFRCIFPGYTEIPQVTVNPTFGLLDTQQQVNPITQTTVFKTVKLHAEFKNFRQKTVLDMFTADSSLADKYADLSSTFQSQWKNSDGTVQSKCVKGCGLTKIDLVSIDPQPFLSSPADIQRGTSDRYGYVYGLSVKVIGLTEFFGHIKRLGSFEIIKKPSNIQFIGDGPFTYSNIITADSPELEKVNAKINDSDYIVAELRNEFIVTSATEMPTSQSLELLSVFDYEFEKTQSITITLDEAPKKNETRQANQQ